MITDWTNSPNNGNETGLPGYVMADFVGKANMFVNVQASPDGKWLKLYSFSNPTNTTKKHNGS